MGNDHSQETIKNEAEKAFAVMIYKTGRYHTKKKRYLRLEIRLDMYLSEYPFTYYDEVCSYIKKYYLNPYFKYNWTIVTFTQYDERSSYIILYNYVPPHHYLRAIFLNLYIPNDIVGLITEYICMKITWPNKQNNSVVLSC